MNDIEPGQPEPGPDAGVEHIQADIEATRAELGETVEALSAKFDVKAQAMQKVDETSERLRPVLPVAAAALVALVVGVLIWKRRR